jgi:hypothetical protein
MKRLFVLRTVLILVTGIVAFAVSTPAQVANNTALVGTVLDSSGSAIAGAKVSAVEESTGVVYPGTTNEQGYYSIKFIPSGTYDITVEQTGFSKLTKTGTIVPIDQAVRTDFTLKVGSETQSVSVSASTPPISTDDATLGETLDTRTVNSLPLMGHNALEAAATESDVSIGPSSGYLGGVPPGEDYIGAGQREIQNLLTLDGITILNSLISLAPARPSTDMISEVQVQSGNFTAQYGNYLGVHINLVTKSGTNSLHGAVYDYLQNTAFNAHQFTDLPGAPNEVQHYNQYGFDVGGPVYLPKLYNGRNKTFFFASWEKIRQLQQYSSGPQTTLTPAEEAGNFGALCSTFSSSGLCTSGTQLTDPYTRNPYPYNQIPADELKTPAALISQKLEQYFPAPNSPATNPPLLNNFQVNAPNSLFFTQTDDRVDENIGSNVRLSFRFYWQNLSYLAGSPFPANNTYGPTDQRNYAVGYTHTITPNLVNDAHAGVNQVVSNSYDYWYENGLKNAGSSLGIPGFTADTAYNNPGIPSLYFDDVAGGEIGNSAANWTQSDRAVDGYDQLTWVHGRHNFMAGFELIRMTIARAALNDPRGSFTFTGGNLYGTGYDASDFVLGLANNSTTGVPLPTGAIGEWRDGFYVLDSWRPTEKLTLNLGLRYELPTVPYSLNGYARILNPQQTALIPASSATLLANFVPTPGFKFIGPNHNDWAPRLGFAYRVTPQTVIRGGIGLYYNANQLNTFTLSTENFPLSAQESYYTGAYSTNPANNLLLTLANPTPGAVSNPIAGIPGTYVNATTMGPHLPTASAQQWNLTVGQSLWQNAGFELQYLGSHDIHLDRDFFNNSPPPEPGSINANRPNQLFGQIRTITNDEWAHYNALTAIFRQRLAHGVSANLSYTWSHTTDISDNSNDIGTTMDQYNIGLDYANSYWDVRQRFVGVATYELPKFGPQNGFLQQALGGWQANTIVTLQTGIPVNVVLGFDQANVTQPRGNLERPNWVHAPSAHCSLKNYIAGNTTSCIDITAFSVPAPYTFGNEGRDTLPGPGLSNVNFSLFKTFPIWEQLNLQFRAEVSNLFNHPNAAPPNAQINDPNFGTGTPASEAQNFNFGTVTGTSSSSNPRYLQLAAKLVF